MVKSDAPELNFCEDEGETSGTLIRNSLLLSNCVIFHRDHPTARFPYIIMPERSETDIPGQRPHRTFLERLTSFISPGPENRTELLDMLYDAHSRQLVDVDTLSMIEGAFNISELAARDIMTPRTQIYTIDITRPIDEWLASVIKIGHSRFPAIEDEIDNVAGIILTKDLLSYFIEEEFDLKEIIRPAVFVPESRRANLLLSDFRNNRNHMSLVVDEYGSIAGLVTIEDVLEQIVGEIHDEYDDEEDDEYEIRLIKGGSSPAWRVSALLELADFNEAIGTSFDEDNAETIGGYIAWHLGSIPQSGTRFEIDDLIFVVLGADTRQIHMLQVEKRSAAVPIDDE